MSALKFVKTSDAITKRLEEMLARGKDNRTFLARVAYPLYQRAQMKIWMTEGSSEGEKWEPLDPAYKAWKRFQFSGFPGNGEKMLIRTGRLVQSVIGNKLESDIEIGSDLSTLPPGHNLMITDTSMVVSSDVEYAKYVNARRNFWKFRTLNKDIKDKYGKWFVSGST